jgi:hypothetical protein
VSTLADRPPPLRLLLGELRVAGTWLRARLAPVVAKKSSVGVGAPVMTIPGFLAPDG